MVVDIFMPVMDGFAAGRQIKLEFPQTRLIYVTLDLRAWPAREGD